MFMEYLNDMIVVSILMIHTIRNDFLLVKWGGAEFVPLRVLNSTFHSSISEIQLRIFTEIILDSHQYINQIFKFVEFFTFLKIFEDDVSVFPTFSLFSLSSPGLWGPSEENKKEKKARKNNTSFSLPPSLWDWVIQKWYNYFCKSFFNVNTIISVLDNLDAALDLFRKLLKCTGSFKLSILL